MPRSSIIPLITLLALMTGARPALAAIEYLEASSNCTHHSASGQITCCQYQGQCTGGELPDFGILCSDVAQPNCDSHSLWSYPGIPPTLTDIGTCDDGENLQQYQDFGWDCCECPRGYRTTTDVGRCGPNPAGYCVGCSGEGEKLSGGPDGTSLGKWSCSNNTEDGDCKTNKAGVDLIKSFEKYRANFYDAGDGDETIGYGHDCTKNNDCDDFSPPLSKADATALLEKDLGTFEKCVGNQPGSSGLNSNQFSALVSYAFNAGCKRMKSNFDSFLKDENYSGICDKLPTTTVTSKGKILKGLVRRRKAESELCDKPDTTKSGCTR